MEVTTITQIRGFYPSSVTHFRTKPTIKQGKP